MVVIVSLVLHVVCLKVVCDCQFGRGSSCPFGDKPCDCLFDSDLTGTISTDGYSNFHICGSIFVACTNNTVFCKSN